MFFPEGRTTNHLLSDHWAERASSNTLFFSQYMTNTNTNTNTNSNYLLTRWSLAVASVALFTNHCTKYFSVDFFAFSSWSPIVYFAVRRYISWNLQYWWCDTVQARLQRLRETAGDNRDGCSFVYSTLFLLRNTPGKISEIQIFGNIVNISMTMFPVFLMQHGKSISERLRDWWQPWWLLFRLFHLLSSDASWMLTIFLQYFIVTIFFHIFSIVTITVSSVYFLWIDI